MANPLRKTMVYLGLADEELEYDEQEQRQEQRQQPAPAAQPAARQSSAAAHASPVAPVPAPAPAPVATRAPVTPLRRSSTSSTSKNTVPHDMNEILTVHPREYKDAQAIAESFRDGIPVIINLSQMTEADARRLVDFASGLSQGLFGKIERVTNKVFLLSPAHIAVSGEQAEVESDIEASFFAQS
ncbi:MULTISPECIES: cell division protein SepF [unclassified Frigoribacterium]|uniref:cell division protein SepF n=1 Tax=unclassified Frigoribacterium TaxID=2627005 RepID=UPI000F489697|nr:MULTISPECIES: cell division protein SepF [unclassified Frigoribacterium]ROP77547.1 cell division inhibitor SepF [Frigoribacterium sp. PhB107]TDT65399.1 cell division inhibitor SepF [Frigoribacterium sp. PhB116]